MAFSVGSVRTQSMAINLGYMGGMAVPAVQKYGYGFLQGAEYAAQEMGLGEGAITVKYHYTGGFDATPEAKAMAASWYKEEMCIRDSVCIMRYRHSALRMVI